MGLILLPKGYHPDFKDKRKKPVKFELDYSHQRVGDLAACFVFDGSVNSRTIDLKNGIIGTNEDPLVVTSQHDQKGQFVNFNNPTGSGAKDGFNLGQPPALNITDEITILSGVRCRANQTANWGRIYSQTNGGSGDQVGIVIEDNGNNTVHFRINNNSTSGGSSANLGTEEYHNVACRYKSESKSIWTDGIQRISTNQSGTINTTGNRKIGNHGDTTARALRGDMYYLYIFNRYLSDAEIRSFNVDPYQILKPTSKTTYFFDRIVSTGWNTQVRDKEVVTSVVRDSSTQITITLSAAPDYDITEQDIITATIPASALVVGGSSIAATPTFTVDIDGSGDNLLADSVESASEVTSPAITQVQVLTANNIQSSSEVSSPSISQAQALTAVSVQSNSEVTSPGLSESHALNANDVESNSEVTTPQIGQEHNLAADNIESNSQVTTPQIGQEHNLIAVSVESNSEVSSPTLTSSANTDNLLAVSVESTSETTAPAIGQIHLLFPVSVSSNSEVTTSTIGQIHHLTPNNVESISEVTSPILGRLFNLFANSVESGSQVSSPGIIANDFWRISPISGQSWNSGIINSQSWSDSAQASNSWIDKTESSSTWEDKPETETIWNINE